MENRSCNPCHDDNSNQWGTNVTVPSAVQTVAARLDLSRFQIHPLVVVAKLERLQDKNSD
eukprot:4986478-Amphidinium_carterae.1